MKYQTKTRVVEAITFDELIEYGRRMTPPNQLMNGMPWAFKYKGYHVTHENDTCYLILGLETDLRMTPGDMLIVGEHGELYTCMHDTFEAGYEPAEATAQPKWQPIATAPLIGKILVYTKGGRQSVAYWCADEWNRRPKPYWQMQCHFNISQSRLDQPIYWMPLPEPPND